MALLSGELVEAYRRDGFLCPVDLFSPDEAARHRAALEAHEAQYSGGGLPRPIDQYQRINAHLTSEAARGAARDPRVLDLAESILGPDLMLWSCEYFIKEPGSAKIVSWHQDLTYWGMGETDHEVTLWVALSPATEQSGCMHFVPGSHRQSIVAHTDTYAADNLLSRGQEIAVEVDESEAVAAALEPGQVSLHHGRMFHASGPNTTGDRRIGFVMRFIRPDTPSTGKGLDYATLMRGADRSRTRINMAMPDGDFTSRGLALYEEVLRAQSATLADGATGQVSFYETA